MPPLIFGDHDPGPGCFKVMALVTSAIGFSIIVVITFLTSAREVFLFAGVACVLEKGWR